MFPTPKKTFAALMEQCGSRLTEPVATVGMFMPRSALVPGQSGRDVKHLMKQPVAVAVTSTGIHVFPFKVGAYSGKVTMGDEIASWPRAGVRVATGSNVQTIRATEFNIGVQQNLVGLQFPDGHGVVFGYTPLGGTMREVEETFVQELSRDAAPPEGSPGPGGFTP